MPADNTEVAAARTQSVLGHFALTTDWRLDGWCWSPDAPAIRQTVEITVNGAVIAICVAAQFNELLRQSGIGDGRCGFSLSPPRQIGGAADGEAVVEAREQQSGTILGRVLFRPEEALAARTQLLERLDNALAARRSAMPLLQSARLRSIGASMAAFGASLRLHGNASPGSRPPPVQGTELQDAIARLLREGTLKLDVSTRPKVSVIVRAADHWQATLAALRHLAKAMPQSAEIILLDDGAHPVTALLAICVPALRILRLASPVEATQALNQAAHMARGETLCIVERVDRLVAWDLLNQAEQMPGAMFGATAAMMLADEPATRAIATWRDHNIADGVTLMVKRTDFMAVGGLEQAMDGSSTAWADLAAKLSCLNVSIGVARTAVSRRQGQGLCPRTPTGVRGPQAP